jgi:hypothetical protein
MDDLVKAKIIELHLDHQAQEQIAWLREHKNIEIT